MSNKKKNLNLKKIEKSSSGENDEMIRMIKVLAGVVLALGAFYFVFAIYNGEISFGGNESEKKEVEIQDTEILVGTTFSRPKQEYYVLMYDFEGDYATFCVSIYNLFLEKHSDVKMYVADLGNAFNSSYVVSERGSVNVNSIDTLKVMNPTLIKVRDGKAEMALYGKEELSNYQDTLLK